MPEEQAKTASGFARLDYIDALRGLAALMVLVFHTVQQTEHFYRLPLWLEKLNAQGARGVQLFYIVSALTLFLTLRLRQEKEGLNVLSFFIRRFFRIAPLFYLALAAYLCLYGLGPRPRAIEPQTIGLGDIVSNLLFVNGFSPYWINSIVPVGWSVAVEMNFYLLVPILFLYVKKLSTAFWFTLLSLIIAIGTQRMLFMYPLIVEKYLWREFLFQWIINQLPVFGLGIMLYFVVCSENAARRLAAMAQRAGMAYGLMIAACLSFLALPWGHRLYIPQHFLSSLALALLVFALALRPAALFVNRFFIFLGKVSYSMYLMHVLAMAIVLRKILPALAPYFKGKDALYLMPISVLLVFVVCVLISFITYKLVEVPGQKLGSKLCRLAACVHH